jgi:predicted ATPase/DNA-binding SARP family transcriptional activator
VTTLSLAFLGPFNVVYDGGVISEFRTRSVQALLAYLTVEDTATQLHQREMLAELLWPGYPPGSARKNLRQALYELGRLIPEVSTGGGPPAPLTLGTRETLQLNPDCRFELDTASFTHMVNEGRDDSLRKAVELYRGDFLEDFTLPDSGEFETWAATRRGRFQRQALEALEHLASTALHKQNYAQAESHARRQLELDDLRESAVGQLMKALAGQGQRSAAIIAFDKTRLRLNEELGIEPGAELSALWEQIRDGEFDAPVDEPSTLTIPSTQMVDKKPALNLPVPTTPFIGRRTEVERIKSLVLHHTHRLITLVGPGGIGKTRLSIQAASDVGEVFPDGVFFVPLATAQTEETFTLAVTKAIDFSFYREEHPRQQLLDYLREQQLLLILDNIENLTEVPELVGEIVASAPSVKLLVTSRVRLNMQGEQLYPVAGMSLPELEQAGEWDNPKEQAKSFSAVQLFLDRARRVQPDFSITNENAMSVIKICQMVQGMPLGLELAAAWVELLSPNEIAAEIARNLDFLETDQVDVPTRQRSIRAVFESSWKLLSEDEQDTFLRLCVFLGSFSREAAQKVSGASLRTLLGLANKSWLGQTDDGRFQLHELMRQYGEGRLKANADKWQNAYDRHAEYFADYVAEQSTRMQGPEQLTGLSAIEVEFDTNIKAAWEWLVSEKRWSYIIDRMALGLFHYGTIRWRTNELITWFRDTRLALKSVLTSKNRLTYAIFSTLEVYFEESSYVKDADPIERLGLTWQMVDKYKLAEAMGFWFVILANLVRARNLPSDIDVDEKLEANIAMLRDGKSQWQLGMSLLYQANRMSGFIHDGTTLLEVADIFEELGVICEQGIAAEHLGKYAYQQRRPLSMVTCYYDQAGRFFRKLKGFFPESGIDLMGVLANIYFQQGKYEQGFAVFKEQQSEFECIGRMLLFEDSLFSEGFFAVRYSTFEHALNLRQRSLELIRKLGSQSDYAWRLFHLGEVYRIFGEAEKAVGLYEQALPLFKKMKVVLGLGFDQRTRGDIALEGKRYQDAMEHYRKFNAYASEDNHLWGMIQSRGRIALAHAYLGNSNKARQEMRSSLVDIYQIGGDDLALQTMLAEPVCLLQEGDMERAIELVSFLQHHPGSWNETKQHADIILDEASRDLDQEVVEGAIERGKGFDFDTVFTALTKLDQTG